MSQRDHVLSTVAMMRESLKETLREASALKRVAIEEEVLIGAENIDKTCNSALRYAAQLQNLVTGSKLTHTRKHR